MVFGGGGLGLMGDVASAALAGGASVQGIIPAFLKDLEGVVSAEEKLIVTPHTAWAALESRQRALDELAANVRDFLAGRRRGRVV